MIALFYWSLGTAAFSAHCAGRVEEGKGSASTDGGATETSAAARIPDNHRPLPVMCSHGPKLNEPDPSMTTGGLLNDCKTNEDCNKGDNGACVPDLEFGAHCLYDECATDADCKSGKACSCTTNHGVRNQCVTAGCSVDADCGPNGFCSPTTDGCGNVTGVHCHTGQDVCVKDSDCNVQQGQQCLFQNDAWACVSPGCPG